VIENAMEKLRSYILVGVLAATLAIPASAWHIHHDDDDHHGNPEESCPVCYVVKATSSAIVTAVPIQFTADISWTQPTEPAHIAGHCSLPTGHPRAPPQLS